MAPGRPGALTGHTIACQDRDFPEWHGGVQRALAWALVLEVPEVSELVAAARARLHHRLLPRYERQPHVTLHFSGLDDVGSAARIDRELEQLRGVLGGPLELVPDGWGTFPMVPYLRLSCPQLHEANRLLTHDAPSEHRMTYVPHVTIGHYSGCWPLAAPLAELDGLPMPRRGPWTVDRLSLVSLATSDIAGPLHLEGTLDLTTGDWVS